MRILLIVLFLFHGIIHFMGFTKAFGLANPSQFTQPITKYWGFAWLIIGSLLIITAFLLSLKKDWWPFLGLLAIILSQVLIIIYWKDAKFGTAVNIILLMASLSGYGEYRFNRIIQKEALEIFENIDLNNPKNLAKRDLEHLPTIVQKWLINSGALQREKVVSVRLIQKGEMKTSPEGKWMPFTAQQFFNCNEPAFIWVTKVTPLPLAYMKGRDKLIDGEGEMTIKLFSLFAVINEGRNPKINAASMQRYLAEMCWFPSVAINDQVTWELIDDTSAKAILTLDKKSVSGIFEFSAEGDFVSFETRRYYGGGENAVLENWFIQAIDYKEFDGIKIPSKCKVTWKLEKGDFHWLNLEITSLEYNKPFLYQ